MHLFAGRRDVRERAQPIEDGAGGDGDAQRRGAARLQRQSTAEPRDARRLR